MANIAGYIANLGKSVAYSASDKMKKMTPATSEFVSTNGELFKSVYSNIRDYKVTYKKSVDMFKKSKIYETGDTLKNSIFEDIKSGKLYNKEREDKITMKMMDTPGDDGFDDSSINFDDFDFSDITDFESDDFTTGDKIVSATVDSSSRKSAEMISKVTARTGEYIVESQKMNTNILYTQSMQGFSMLNSNLTSINENIGQMINFSNEALGQHVKVSADYYTKSIELMQDQTALLREIAGYLRPVEKKEEKSKERITYDDIVGAQGTPDLKLYMERVKKNIENNSSLGMVNSMNNMFGGNALSAVLASPLQFIPNYIVNSLVPNTVETAMQDLDKSFGNLFGSVIAKLNTMARDENSGILASTIGSIFGISTSAKKDIDTSKYEKGKVDWDGKSRKALIEVIPTQLAKIVSLLSGQEESIYDYDKGKFIKASSIEKEYKNKLESYSKSATSDMKDFFDEYSKLLTFNSMEEKKKFDEDIKKFLTKLYDDGKLFDVNRLSEDAHMDFGIDSKNLAAIKAMYKNAPKYMQHAINNDILTGRNKQTAEFEALEKEGTSNLMYMFNGSNINEFIKENKLDKTKTESTSLLARGFDKITDSYGKNIFYYLQNMFKELSYIRQYGTMTGNNMPHIPSSMRIISSDGSEYIPESKTINDIIIPRNKQYSDSENKARQEERARQKFIESERKRIEKNQSLIKYSEIDDDKTIENELSAMIKTDQVKKRLEMEEKKDKSIVDKLLEAGSLSEKTSVMFSKLNEVTSKPMKFVTGIIENVDQRMYEFIYGKETTNGEVKGFLDLTLYELKNTFRKFNSFLDEKILTPLKEKLDADTMKEAFKNLLGKMGIDVDHMSETIKSFFFGEKDSEGKRKGGIFGETIEATKEAGKNVFGFIKESFKDTFSPIINKGKDFLFRSRNENLFRDLDEDEYDENGNSVYNGRRGESLIQERINNLTDRRYTTGKTQEYYDSIDWDSEENINYQIKHNYIAGQRSINSEEQELESIENELERLRVVRASMSNRSSRARIIQKVKKLEKRRNFLKQNIDQYYSDKDIYTGQLKDKKYSNIQKYFSENIASALGDEVDNDDINNVMNHLFEANKEKYKATGFKDFTVEDFMRSARSLSQSTGEDKYESIIDSIANYVDRYYGEDITKKLSVLADDSGKLIDPNNWYRTEGLPTTAEEFYTMLQESNSPLLQETISANEKQLNVFNQIAEDIRSLRDLFSSIGQNQPQHLGPRIGLRPELINNPEGRATYDYAQNLATMIANWMYGNMSHFDEGGYIDKAMVATVGEGEVVLSKENVDRLTSIFNDLMDDVNDKEKSISSSTAKAFDRLLPMVKKGEISYDNYTSIAEKVMNENPILRNKYADNFELNNKVFSKIYHTMIDYNKNPSELNPVQQALYQDTKPFVEKMGEEFIDGLGAVKRSLFGSSEKDDKKNFGEMITDITSNVSKYAPKAIGAGVIGGGISLLTGALGGPLLGAAVGAGISLTKQSEKVQNFLFGELDENGERTGGLVGKNTQDLFKKYIPDMGKLGLVGGLVAPLITPLGPVGGIIAGSALGFAKNNKDVMDLLYGEQGFFRPEDKEKLEKVLPKLALGAGIGALTGPFGLMGNIVLGSGIAMATTHEGFREAIFGKYNENTGEFESGLLPSMRQYIIEPLKENAEKYRDTFFDYIKEQIFKPVATAIDPIRTEIALMVRRPFEKVEELLAKAFENSFAPLRDWVQDKFVKPLTDKTKWLIGGIVKLAGGIVASPFKAIGAVGDHLRMKQIARGEATYMTATERVEARNKLHDKSQRKYIKFLDKDQTGHMDIMLSRLSKEDPSKIQDLSEMVNAALDTKNYMAAKRKSLGKEIGSDVGQYFSYKDNKKIMKALSKGNGRYAMELMEQMSMREGIPESERNKFLKEIQKKVNNFGKFEDSKETQDLIRESMYEELRKLGIKDISDKNLSKYQKYINAELRHNKKNIKESEKEEKQGPETPEIAYYRESIDILKNIASLLEKNNGIAEKTTTVIDELKDVMEEGDNVLEDNGDVKTIITPDGKTKVVRKTSDGKWITDGEEDDDNKSKAGEIINQVTSKDDEEEDDGEYKKQKSSFFGIMYAAKMAFKGLKTAVLTTLGLIMAPKIVEAARTHIFPLLGDMWHNHAKPWIENEGLPLLEKGMQTVGDLVKDGLVFLAENIIPLAIDGLKFTIGELVPAVARGVWAAIKGFFGKDENSEDTVLGQVPDTVLRHTVTGGETSTKGLNFLNKATGREARVAAKAAEQAANPKKVGMVGKLVNKITGKGAVNAATDIAEAAEPAKVGKIGKFINGAGDFLGKVSNNGIDALSSLPTDSKVLKVTKYIPGLGLASRAIQGTMGLSKAGAGIFRTGTNIIGGAAENVGKVAGAVGKVYDKIDNTAFMSNLRSKAKNLFEKKTTKLGEAAINISQNNALIKSAMDKLSNLLEKLFTSKNLRKILDEKTIAKLSTEFAPNFLKAVGEQAVKNADKMAAKMAGIATTGGLLNVAMAVGDFISGYNDAKNILSITEEPSLGAKIVSGLLKAILGFGVITSLIPEKLLVDLLLDHVAKSGFDDLKEQRKQAKSIVEQYNKENDTNFTVREYNNKMKEIKKAEKYKNSDYNNDGKVGVIEKARTNISNAWSKFKSFFSFGKGEEDFDFEVANNAGRGISKTIGRGRYIGKGGSKTDSKIPTRVNNFSYFSQYDNRWDEDENSMLKKAGCGPTSVAMLLSESLGKPITPTEISSEAYAKGLWNEKGASSEIFGYFGNKYNIPVKDVKKNWDTFDQLASQGIPQAVSGKGTAPYTTTGHIITVLGKDANGNYIVNDPLGIQRSKTYTINDIKNGWNNSWAFGGDNLLSINDFNMQNPELVGAGNDAKIKMYEKVIQYARAFKGKLKYSMDGNVRQWINNNKLGADCSSFTQHVFKTVAGIDIGANTGQQLTKNSHVRLSPDEGQPGDLILFKGTYNSSHPEGVSHVGIISDNNGNMIDQGSSGAAPKERSYNSAYWKPKRLAAMRVLPNPNELVDPKVVGGNTAVGDVVGSSLGLTNNGQTNSNSTDSTSTTTTQVQSGLDGLMTDLGNIATSVMDKVYKFDSVGKGGVDEDINKVNPAFFTDFEDNKSADLIKSKLNKLKHTKETISKLKPVKMSESAISKLKDKVFNKKKPSEPFYNGMGGNDQTATKTVKSVKGIPIGTKALSENVTRYQDIFNKYGNEFGVDPYIMMAICMGESGGKDYIKAARGLMQIENGGTTDEFIKFGKTRPNGPYNEADRSDPDKAIPFATHRIASDLKHYSGDYIKTIQAYNFSKYSLDALIKAFPNGDDWMAQRANVGQYNGTGKKKYGTPDYVERVLAFYHGNSIPSDGVVTVPYNGSGANVNTENQVEETKESGFFGFISDLGNLATNTLNKLYGFETATTTPDGTTPDVDANLDNSGEKTSDNWFLGHLKGSRVSSKYGPRIHPISKKPSTHTGIDYAVAQGTEIRTPIGGTVISNVKQSTGYGNHLKLKDPQNGVHLFAHMAEKSPLSVGSTITAGTVVGKVGSTGASTGPHLHYEIRTSEDSKTHTEPNAYLTKIANLIKPNKSSNSNNNSKQDGKGGVDQPIKTPTIPLSRKPIGSKEQPVKETNVLDNSRLLAVIIEILHKIANNTSSLSEIVQLLSKSLNINIPEESLKEIKSNNTSLSEGNKQIVNIIKNSIKSDSNNNSGNEYLLQTLEKLALE